MRRRAVTVIPFRQTSHRRGRWIMQAVETRKVSTFYRMTAVLPAPVETAKQDELPSPGWIVTVYNNETNTYDEVMTVLMLATGCDAEEAFIETWEVDHLGKSVVHLADETECEGVAAIIRRIGIEVSVTQG